MVDQEVAAAAEAKFIAASIVEVPTEARREPGAVVSRQDLAILQAGPPNARLIARRDLFIAIAVTAAVGAAGIIATASFSKPLPAGGGTTPDWYALGFTSALAAAALSAGVVAFFSDRDARAAAGRSAFGQCLAAIEEQITRHQKV